jgi:hypothetical protein
MFYIDPPYGVKFGSNFQPFIRKREVKHNEDEDFTREPEMVQAYRDTWELGLLRSKLDPAMNAEEGCCIRAVRRIYAELAGISLGGAPEPGGIV